MVIMTILATLFPFSFLTRKKSTGSLVISILIYAAMILTYFLLSFLLGFFLSDLISWLLGLLGSLVGLYCTVGIILSVLRFCGIVK